MGTAYGVPYVWLCSGAQHRLFEGGKGGDVGEHGMLLFGGRVVWKHDAFGPPAWGGGVEGVRVGAELFVVRVVVGVLASVLASAVSDREGGDRNGACQAVVCLWSRALVGVVRTPLAGA